METTHSFLDHSAAFSEASASNDAPEKTRGNLLDSYFTRSELASSLNFTTRKLDRLHKKGLGPPRTMIGRLVLYRKESVVAWLQKQEVSTARRNALTFAVRATNNAIKAVRRLTEGEVHHHG